ncbi:hypothetical protein GCM10008939_27190 [Deinococcus aquiradiocola]|uniref:Uncharacterized protein n=2 Tax=Deinococcus aquiradiocola TaxID=393059 RepID=A0A917PK39_9DEIO|nr:hypothetical protein GCM10008939_27190 [Deinococcus aquiradiocola]
MGEMSTPNDAALSWRDLESRTGLDALPAFHRAFLTWRGVPDVQAMPLRRVSQRVEAELNRMAQAGEATREPGEDQDDWHVNAETLAPFLAGQGLT